MRFSKMHGAGNDYVYVDCFEESVPVDAALLAERVSDRHFGIGADGLVLVLPDPTSDARMRMFNADGSEAEMCGNALRCVGWLLRDRGHVDRDVLRIRTGRGVLDVNILERTSNGGSVCADMGSPALGHAPDTTTDFAETDSARVQLSVLNTPQQMTLVSMGNPHCVIFCENVDTADVTTLGPLLETHEAFPDRTNVEFVEVVNRAQLRVRVWERGSGETLACGTGAAASVVAAVLNRVCDRHCAVSLAGGRLEVDWAANGSVRMTGPVAEVYRGRWLL